MPDLSEAFTLNPTPSHSGGFKAGFALPQLTVCHIRLKKVSVSSYKGEKLTLAMDVIEGPTKVG